MLRDGAKGTALLSEPEPETVDATSVEELGEALAVATTEARRNLRDALFPRKEMYALIKAAAACGGAGHDAREAQLMADVEQLTHTLVLKEQIIRTLWWAGLDVQGKEYERGYQDGKAGREPSTEFGAPVNGN